MSISPALRAAAVVACLATPLAVAAAQPITIVNAGFETGPLSDGQFAPFAFGWVSGGASGTAGALNPGNFSYPPIGAVPEGQNVGYINAGGSLTQTLTAVLQANTTYTLSYFIGNRADMVFAGYLVELRAGSTTLASQGSLTPGEGVFLPGSVSYTSGASDPLLGQSLVIRMSAPGDQANFDAVALHGTSVVPEPATLALLATGMLVLGGATAARRKRPAG